MPLRKRPARADLEQKMRQVAVIRSHKSYSYWYTILEYGFEDLGLKGRRS